MNAVEAVSALGLSRRGSLVLPVTLLVFVLAATSVSGQQTAAPDHPTGCTDCHVRYNQPPEKGVLADLVANSVHGDFDCTDCHDNASMDDIDLTAPMPHTKPVGAIECRMCHDDVAEAYQKHGRFEVGQDPDVPKCWDCHGAHGVKPSSAPDSLVNRLKLADTCMRCHTDLDLIKKHDILRVEPIRLYTSSVHARATERGLFLAATCSDCHSAPSEDGKPTAHRILSPADPDSTIHHFNIPDTCGKCHRGTTADYWEGIHGQLARRGEVDAPVCTHCHGEHGILPASDYRSPVSAAKLAEATCAPCHESASLNERYGIPPGRLKSYVDSYHGLKRKAGNVNVANCASCHGSHRILPHTDPRSSIHQNNLQHTCGECHPRISEVLAQIPIHETATGIKAGWPRFFTILYYWLIGITIGLMLLHNIGHWYRSLRRAGRSPYVIRLTPGETAQHWILMISFIVLVFSGFSLRFSEAWWVELMFGWGGGEGFVIRGLIHRVAAVLFMIWALWHLFYLMSRRGRTWLRDMIGSTKDLLHIKQNALYFLNRSNPPSFGRFSYMEKCEYWALIWGAVIMTITGVLLWFDNFFIERWALPKGLLDVALVIHYYEAWLATLAILVWHIYGTVFSPEVYPMNPAWLTGKMPKAMYDHEHPGGPGLKGRTDRLDPEAEEAPQPTETPAVDGGTST